MRSLLYSRKLSAISHQLLGFPDANDFESLWVYLIQLKTAREASPCWMDRVMYKHISSLSNSQPESNNFRFNQPSMITSQVNTLNTISILNELINIQEQNSSCSLWQFRSLISANQYRLLYQYFLKYVPQGSEVLDWGCGNGHFSYFLVSSGYKTSGFSFEDFCLRSNLNNFAYQFKQGSLEEPTVISFLDN